MKISEETLNFLKDNVKDPVDLATILTALEEDLDPSKIPPGWEAYNEFIMAGGVMDYKQWYQWVKSSPAVLFDEVFAGIQAPEVDPQEEKIIKKLQDFILSCGENISHEQWKLLRPVLRERLIRLAPVEPVLKYSRTARLWHRERLGHKFYPADDDTNGTNGGVFAYENGVPHLDVVSFVNTRERWEYQP